MAMCKIGTPICSKCGGTLVCYPNGCPICGAKCCCPKCCVAEETEHQNKLPKPSEIPNKYVERTLNRIANRYSYLKDEDDD